MAPLAGALHERLVEPKGPPPAELPCLRELLRKLVTSAPWAGLVIAAATFDAILCAQAGFSQSAPDKTLTRRGRSFFYNDSACTFIVLLVYVLDVVLKVYAFTLVVYLRKWGNIMDATITSLSLLLAFFEESVAASNAVAVMRYPRILRLLLRLVRIGHCGRACKWAQVAFGGMATGARHITGVHKKRFVDPAHDFDLDLVYIEPRLIGMSVPASSFWTRLYRNPISEVVRFFEAYHPSNYMIVNCCPELPYPTTHFTSGNVIEFDIQDHTPPKIGQVVEFLNVASAWMQESPDRIIAVHCKGGKGRTGSLCGAWMLYTRSASDGMDACEKFALARTEISSKSKQTVDTPSQVRYLDHICSMLAGQGAYYPAPVVEPPPVRLRPLRLSLRHWFKTPVADELLIAIHMESGAAGRVVYWSRAFHHDADGSASIEFSDAPRGLELLGDIRISVFARAPLEKARKKSSDGIGFVGDLAEPRGDSKRPSAKPRKRPIAGKEPGCLFYCLFHTSFAGVDGRLEVPVRAMDKAGKGKHRKHYFPDGLAAVEFSVACRV